MSASSSKPIILVTDDELVVRDIGDQAIAGERNIHRVVEFRVAARVSIR